MTKEEAVKLYESKFWEGMNHQERAEFQLFESRLCMPIGVFHEAIEKALDRPVWTHEFASSNIESLRSEFLGDRPAPSFMDIVDLIPKEKRLIVVA